IESELIDIRKIPIRMEDAGEALKDSEFSVTVDRADGLILVVPEYNHSFPRSAETCARYKLEGIHSQSSRRLQRISWSVWRRAHDPEFGPGAARTRPGHNFLGCLFRHGRKAFRSCHRQDHRSRLRRSPGKIPERTRLDGALSSPRA